MYRITRHHGYKSITPWLRVYKTNCMNLNVCSLLRMTLFLFCHHTFPQRSPSVLTELFSVYFVDAAAAPSGEANLQTPTQGHVAPCQ